MSDLPPPQPVVPPPPQPARKSWAPFWIVVVLILAGLGAWWIGERQADDRSNGAEISRDDSPSPFHISLQA